MKIQLPTAVASYCLIFAAICISTSAYSQSISGKILSPSGSPVYNANVLMLKSTDSSLVKACISDKTGSYNMRNIKPGNYILSASIIGYKTAFTSSPVIINESVHEINVPAITLAEDVKQLNEVNITATRPFIVQGIDRTIVNVANSIVMAGGTALEVLEKAPGVTVDQQNNIISLMGKTGVIIYINGKQSYLSPEDITTLLKTMPADNIDNIELITNPSAQYDAAGNAGIINIRLKKNDNIGTNGNLSLSAETGRYDSELGNLRLNHRTAKFNLFGNYSISRWNNIWRFNLEREWSQDGERNILEDISPIRSRGYAHNATAGIDYSIGKSTIMGLTWNGQWNSGREQAISDASFRHTASEQIYYQTRSLKSDSDKISNQVLNVNIQHAFNNNGGLLTADFDLGYYRRAFENNLLTTTLIPDSPPEPRTGMRSTMPVSINVRSIKADYSLPLNKNWKMDAGIKSSWVQSDNNLVLLSGEENKLQPDPDLSEHFQYTEQINAAYIHFAGDLKASTKILGGLRVENTHSVGNAISHNDKVTRNYTNLFPSALLSRAISKNHILTFSYSYRIDRPAYQSLNPVRHYLDPFAYSRGNPFLNPQYTHSLELKHGYREKIFTSFNASFISGLKEYIVQPVNLKQYERVPENMGNAQSYSLAVSFPLTILPSWKIQTSLLGIFGRYRFNYIGSEVIAKQESGKLNVNNSFTFKKGWSAELSGELSSPSTYLVTHTPWLGYVNAGLQKKLGARWKFDLKVNDIFYTQKIALGYINTGGFYMHTLITSDSRRVSLTASYAFGNQKIKEARQRKTAAEEEMGRTN